MALPTTHRPVYIPPGGATDAVLKKTSGTDFDVEWSADFLLKSGGAMTGDIDMSGNVLDNASELRMSAQASNAAMASDDLVAFFNSSDANDGIAFADLAELRAWLKMPRVVHKEAEGVKIDDSGTETALVSYTVPADALGAEDMLRLRLLGKLDATAGTFTLRVKLGASTIYADGFTMWTNGDGVIEVELLLSAKGSTSAQTGGGRVLAVDGTTPVTTGLGDLGSQGAAWRYVPILFADSSVDMTSEQTFQVTGEFSGSVNTLTLIAGIVEFLPGP